jgi:hypothetical protein
LRLDGADDRSFAGTNATGSITLPAFFLMPVLGQAADESFIDFDNATTRFSTDRPYISKSAERSFLSY